MADKRSTIPEAARSAGYTMTVDDVAEEFGVVRNSVYRWISAGRLTGIKVGNRRYFKPKEVADLRRSMEGGVR